MERVLENADLLGLIFLAFQEDCTLGDLFSFLLVSRKFYACRKKLRDKWEIKFLLRPVEGYSRGERCRQVFLKYPQFRSYLLYSQPRDILYYWRIKESGKKRGNGLMGMLYQLVDKGEIDSRQFLKIILKSYKSWNIIIWLPFLTRICRREIEIRTFKDRSERRQIDIKIVGADGGYNKYSVCNFQDLLPSLISDDVYYTDLHPRILNTIYSTVKCEFQSLNL